MNQTPTRSCQLGVRSLVGKRRLIKIAFGWKQTLARREAQRSLSCGPCRRKPTEGEAWFLVERCREVAGGRTGYRTRKGLGIGMQTHGGEEGDARRQCQGHGRSGTVNRRAQKSVPCTIITRRKTESLLSPNNKMQYVSR